MRGRKTKVGEKQHRFPPTRFRFLLCVKGRSPHRQVEPDGYWPTPSPFLEEGGKPILNPSLGKDLKGERESKENRKEQQ